MRASIPATGRCTVVDRGAGEDRAAPERDGRVSVDGVQPGETAYVTLAAVDVGILNVTRLPAARRRAGYYFGKRRLGVEIRDLYSKLIDRMQGAPGSVRSGGDAGASYDSPPPMETLVALLFRRGDGRRGRKRGDPAATFPTSTAR